MNVSPLKDPAPYLRRIGHAVAQRADADALAMLHEAHLRAIPFENFDIPLGRPIRLDPDWLMHKMVRGGRGGFCFEQNMLFAAALGSLGFKASAHLARVAWRAEGRVRPRTHQLLLVQAGGRDWLCDVGFGGPGLRFPIPFELDHENDQPGGTFRLSSSPDFGYRLDRYGEEGWEALYLFDLHRCWPADFAMGCHFAASHPDSLFTRHLVANRLTASGRGSLLDDRLTIERDEQSIECITIEDRAAFGEVLRRHFGIDLATEAPDALETIWASRRSRSEPA